MSSILGQKACRTDTSDYSHTCGQENITQMPLCAELQTLKVGHVSSYYSCLIKKVIWFISRTFIVCVLMQFLYSASVYLTLSISASYLSSKLYRFVF